jgi:hypothetical protein
VAILRAAAGLRGEDRLDLNLGPGMREANLMSERDQVGQPFVGKIHQRARVVRREGSTVAEESRAAPLEDVGHSMMIVPLMSSPWILQLYVKRPAFGNVK